MQRTNSKALASTQRPRSNIILASCILNLASDPQCPSYATCWDQKVCVKCGESTSTAKIAESLHAIPSKTVVVGGRAGARVGDMMQRTTLQTHSKPSQAKRPATYLQDEAVGFHGYHPSPLPIPCPIFLIKRNSPIDAPSFRWLLAPSCPKPNHTPLKTIGPDLP
ncbi:hypothetical protein FJTKL_13379 [Diaporthe vaccinii]|uniref:Uncharacterized protein n=1 Tax=Diaporthe vaccinii TaxID=105482 RepID=A0ABR4EAL9_9PEZI